MSTFHVCTSFNLFKVQGSADTFKVINKDSWKP